MKPISLFFILWLIVSSTIGQTLKGKTNAVTVDYSAKEMQQEKKTEGAVVKAKRKYRALIMGVSKYEHEGPNLPSLDKPVLDAQMVYDTLTRYYTFEPDDVILLKNPTQKTIIDALEKLSEETTENDNVLIFYAGHGVWDKEKNLGYWMPSDVVMQSKNTWIPNSTIKDYLNDNTIKAKHTLLITDACFGGSIFKSREVSTEMALRINELYREPSRTAMTSGNLSAVPDKSIFIQQLVKKLADNEEDLLTARHLYMKIYDPIINNSSTTPVYGVIQGAGDGGGDFIFEKRKNR